MALKTLSFCGSDEFFLLYDVDVIVKRWQDFTGAEAKRASDGARFEVKPDPATRTPVGTDVT